MNDAAKDMLFNNVWATSRTLSETKEQAVSRTVWWYTVNAPELLKDAEKRITPILKRTDRW